MAISDTDGMVLNKNRLILLIGFLALVGLVLFLNLVRIQIFYHSRFERMADFQQLDTIPLYAQRGIIYDRNGYKFAANTLHYDLAVDPKLVKRKSHIAQECARALGNSQKYYLEKMNRPNRRYAPLGIRIPEQQIRSVLKINDPGLIKTENFRRSYPYNSVAAQLLGYTDPYDKGISGLEKQFDKELRGKNGQAVLQFDARRKMIFYNADSPLQRPENGINIFLTIDKNIQSVVEQELAEGVQHARGRTGMAIVMDPFSGAILAMVNYPSFDPARQVRFDDNLKRNRAVTDIFEPGSTMKVFTAAALLQEGVHDRNDRVFCENGVLRMYNRSFHDVHKNGWLTFSEVVAKSSNIGMIKLSKEFPGNTLFRYLKNFGFGSATGVGLDGEESGQIDHPNQWSGLSKASLAIGYGLNATTVQLAAAYCAIINGGNLYRPYVIDRLEDEQGEVISESKSEVIRQVISPEVSNELKYYMSLVVKDGTGKAAKVNGVEVGGKTGTARKIKSTGGYYDNKYISSFAGFAPYDHPKYFCLIVVEEPGNGMIYGGDVSAPVFSKVISRIINLQEEAEMPEEEIDKILVEAESDLPPLQGLTQTNAVKLLQARDVDYKITGAGEFVEKITHEDDEVILHLGNAPNRSQQVPRFVGLTVREALTRIDFSRYKVQLQGKRAGIVRNQSPAPGLKIRGKTQIVLTCN